MLLPLSLIMMLPKMSSCGKRTQPRVDETLPNVTPPLAKLRLVG
jgi:hypothetical protein